MAGAQKLQRKGSVLATELAENTEEGEVELVKMLLPGRVRFSARNIEWCSRRSLILRFFFRLFGR